jgi:hypothetical protein
MRFEVKLDDEIIGYSDLELHGDRSMGGACGRFVPAPAYAAVPMPNLTLWLAGGGQVECVGGVRVNDYSVELGQDIIEFDVAGVSDPSYDELFPDWKEMEFQWKRKSIETALAEATRSYLPIHGSGNESEQKQLQQVCSALDRLLALWLGDAEAWSPYYWNDGIIASPKTPSHGALELEGLAIWVKDTRSESYWEPFSAVVRVPEAGDVNDRLSGEVR